MRQKIVAGNWKMNKTLSEAQSLTSEIANMVEDEAPSDVKVIIAPPFPFIYAVQNLIPEMGKIVLAGQNCHQEDSGAFTGEVSAPMLKSLGAQYVILGHSERREQFSETDEELAQKTNNALKNDLKVIFCCGEPLDIREADTQNDYVTKQLTNSLFHLSEEQFKNIVIAYEPIWAIGTGKTASSEQAQNMHRTIRDHIASKFGQALADETSILYGGSCKPDNAQELFSQADVDGGLIGGASLKSRDFTDIIKSF
ncbi:triose-phosphate isomerase [Marivirga arenosa]|uniref:Triosephosphate isomerase n=1 Tax=Marivirga arenosa TaxID=3059076 RepID=A0AA51R9I8_9BACT|nr:MULTISPECIES: triose-phosphate isomerase [unclassified Marivirga]WMN07671.1 triose-phosphate isomerase [Marivirga sp. ABR2-2]WNB18115.1 triose-phosphate isomerase [Marivirga sp. BKB1-2]